MKSKHHPVGSPRALALDPAQAYGEGYITDPYEVVKKPYVTWSGIEGYLAAVRVGDRWANVHPPRWYSGAYPVRFWLGIEGAIETGVDKHLNLLILAFGRRSVLRHFDPHAYPQGAAYHFDWSPAKKLQHLAVAGDQLLAEGHEVLHADALREIQAGAAKRNPKKRRPNKAKRNPRLSAIMQKALR